MTIFGDYIREARQDLGMTLQQLADKVGISASLLSRIENGKRGVPSSNRLISIAYALGLNYKELGQVVQESLEEEQRQLEPSPPALENFMEFVEDAAGVARIPVLKNITPNDALLCSQHIVGSKLFPVDEIDEEYFYFEVVDNSMRGIGIQSGDLVLIRVGDYPTENKICLVIPEDGTNAVLRLTSYSRNQKMMVFSSTDFTSPILVPRFGGDKHVKVLGTAVHVEHPL